MSQPFDLFVISLQDAQERRAHMRAELERQGVEYVFFDAVNGRELDPAAAAEWIDDARTTAVYGKPLTPGEKGCALSHIRLWEKVAAGSRDALILEDDVFLPGNALLKQVAPLLPELKRDRVILLRHIANAFWWRGAIALPGTAYTLRKPNHRTVMAAAYLLTPQAAGALVAFLRRNKLAHPLDWWYRPDGFGYTRVVDTWAVCPEMIPSHYGLESTIDATEGDRDGLKHLGRMGRLKRRLFLAARRMLFPWMRLVRSFWFQPIWPETKSPDK